MRNGLHSGFQHACRISLIALQFLVLSNAAGAACYRTPNAALDAIISKLPLSSASENAGYRVTRIETDPILTGRWAMIVNCSHPEWPTFALPVREGLFSQGHSNYRNQNALAKTAFLVHAGDAVQLWIQEDVVRIEVAGVSEENGAMGNTIRVRLLHGAVDGPSSATQFAGIVRGPLNVEIQP